MDTSARARELALLGIEVRATQSQNTGNTGGGTLHEPKGSPKGGQFTASPSGGGGGYKSILPPESGYKSGGGGKKKATTTAAPQGVPQAPAEPRTMKSGDSGEDVRYAQYAMNLLGFKVAQDGNYGPDTEAAVKQIQERLGVKKPNGHLSAAQLHKLQDAVRLSPCIGAGQRDLEAEAQWESRFAEPAEPAGPDLDEDGMAEAVTDALDEFVARSFWGDWEERAHDVSGELRIPGGVGGGRWTKSPVTAAILKALKEGKGDDPFQLDGKPIDREPLRKAAVARGITLKRGASREDIVKALLADAGKGKGEGAKAAPSAPSPRADAKARYAAVAQSRPYASAAAAVAELTGKKQSNAVIAEHVRAIAHPDSPDMAEAKGPLTRGSQALDAAPVSMLSNLERPKTASAPSSAERVAFEDYGNNGQAINARLRGGGRTTPQIAAMDAALSRSPLSSDVELWRGVSTGSDLPGLDLTRKDLSGAEFADPSFVSTSTERAVAERFAQLPGNGPKVVLQIRAQKGTGGVAFSGGGITESQHEMLLERGLTFRVTADHGDANGLRHLEVEVVPKAGASTAAHDLEQVAAAFEAGNPALGKRRMSAALKKQGITQGPGGTVPFDPAAHEHLGAASAEAVREVVVENKIRAAFRGTGAPDATFVDLAKVRENVGPDFSAAEVDNALRRMERDKTAHLAPQDYANTLTPKQKAAAVKIGGRDNHLIRIDDTKARPLPDVPAAGTPVAVVRPGMSLHRGEGDHVQLSKAVVMSAPGKAPAKVAKAAPKRVAPAAPAGLTQTEDTYLSTLHGADTGFVPAARFPNKATLTGLESKGYVRRVPDGPDEGSYEMTPAGRKAFLANDAEYPNPAEILSSLPADLTPAQKRARLRSRGVSAAEIDALVPLKSAKAARTPLGPGGADDLAEEFYRHPKYTEQQIHDRLAGLNLAELKKVATATNVGLPRDLIKTEAGPVFQPLKKISADDLRRWIAAKIAGDRRLLANEDKFTNAARSQDLDEVDDEPDDDDTYDDEPSPMELHAMAGGSTARARELALLGIEIRALGHDVTPGHDELHHYWTKGPGLAKWVGSPHQWTTLYHHLVKYVTPEQAKRMAAAWVHEVTGFWPGSDMHRVLEGSKPRGHRIGPG